MSCVTFQADSLLSRWRDVSVENPASVRPLLPVPRGVFGCPQEIRPFYSGFVCPSQNMYDPHPLKSKAIWVKAEDTPIAQNTIEMLD